MCNDHKWLNFILFFWSGSNFMHLTMCTTEKWSCYVNFTSLYYQCCLRNNIIRSISLKNQIHKISMNVNNVKIAFVVFGLPSFISLRRNKNFFLKKKKQRHIKGHGKSPKTTYHSPITHTLFWLLLRFITRTVFTFNRAISYPLFSVIHTPSE